MLSFNHITPTGVAARFAGRVRLERLARGWSRRELAERAGVAAPTLRVFEDTGKISLERLLRLADVLGFLGQLELIATRDESVQSLAEFESRHATHRRQRGRTLRTEGR